MNFFQRGTPLASTVAAALTAAGTLAASAALVNRNVRAAERANPPTGTFVQVDGVRVHFIERGAGPPVVLLHGNGVTSADWEVSGVFEGLAERHRVIAFDRPGFGYSERPRDRMWTPAEQARLIADACAQLGVVRPVVVGHSWGTLVALALTLDPAASVERLVLVSGYYFASPRIDALASIGAALPGLGDLLRHTVLPLIGQATAGPVIANLFAPAPVPERFARFPLALALRPSQLRATAEEATIMVPSAAQLEARYAELKLPVAIIAGDGDKIADPTAQSQRLAKLLGVDAQLIGGAGHMVHYAVPQAIVEAASSHSGAEALRR